jgi:hypothetical protein
MNDVWPVSVYTRSPPSDHTRISLRRVTTMKMKVEGAHLSAHDANPMSGIKANERTTALCPAKVCITLCCCHSLIVLSAEPAHSEPENTKEHLRRTGDKLVLVYRQHVPDTIFVSLQLIRRIEVLPDPRSAVADVWASRKLG